jgi:hypothetical protein
MIKLQTPDYLVSHPFEPHIKQFMLGGQKAMSQFANYISINFKLALEDLKVVQEYLSTTTWVVSQWYLECAKFIKSSKLHLDRLYVSTKNLYDILNSFLKVASLLRDLSVNSVSEQSDKFKEVLSTLNMSMNELAQQINLEQTTYLTTALQFKDSVKSLELELSGIYTTLEPTINPEAPVLTNPLLADNFINTPYSPYLELSINEIVDSLHKPHG